MKKVLFFIMLCFCFAMPSRAELSNGVTLELVDEGPDVPYKTMSIYDQAATYLEVGKYFNDNYPDDKINEEFHDKLAEFFPNLSKQELFDRERTVRDFIKVYRFGKDIYKEIQEKIIAPPPPALIFSDDEYDTPYRETYIKGDKDKVVIIEDFKKVLSYGNNTRDFDAYKAKQIRDSESGKEKSGFGRLLNKLSKIELKKLPFYGTIYPDPLSGTFGQGEWVQNGLLRARLIANVTSIDTSPEIKGALHLSVPPNVAVLAVNQSKPKINFANSKNLEKVDTFYPTPGRYVNAKGEDIIGYGGVFAIPLIFKIKNLNEPLLLSAQVKLTLCTMTECHEVEVAPALVLDKGDGYYSSVVNFVDQSFLHLPSPQNKDAIIKGVVEYDGVLKIVIETNENIKDFDIFAENSEGWKFLKPKTTIEDGWIIAKLRPQENYGSLIGKKFIITANINDRLAIRQEVVVGDNLSLQDITNKVNFKKILSAIWIGVLLALLSAALPILMIKKQQLWGIALGFITAGTYVLMSPNFMFGMQLQNPYILVAVLFVICVALAQVWGLSRINTSGFVLGLASFVVASVVYVPNLDYFLEAESIVLWISAFIGFSLVYLILQKVSLPKNLVVMIVLLNLMWLFWAISSQTTWGTFLRLLLYVVLFEIVLVMGNMVFKKICERSLPEDLHKKACRHFKVRGTWAIITIILLATLDITYNFKTDNKALVDMQAIADKVNDKGIVILKLEPKWCVACVYNNIVAFDKVYVEQIMEHRNVSIMSVDAGSFSPAILEFMDSFEVKSLPVYIIFGPRNREGTVLPKILEENDLIVAISGA